MTVQVKHEAEHYRQHARYRIPALVIYKGAVFKVAEWSVAGLSIVDLTDTIKDHQQFKAHMSFNFGAFRLSVLVEIEKLRTLSNGAAACRFTNLSTENLSVFHQVINAYLAGEVVEVGDILNVVSREGMVTKDFADRLNPDRTWWQVLLFQAKRALGYLLFGSIIFGLFMFVFSTAYERIFVIESVSAKVSGNVTLLRSPENGFFQDSLDNVNKRVQKGELMGIVKLVAGGASSVESPCDCIVVERFVEDGIFVGKGESVYSVMNSDNTLFVEAQIQFEDVKKIRVGQVANVLLTNGRTVAGRVDKVLANNRNDSAQGAAFGFTDLQLSENATVIVTLQERIDVRHLDSVSYVTINTLKEPI